MMRNRVIIVLLCGLTASPGALGQKKTHNGGRIICTIPRAKLAKFVRPSYPEEAKKAHIQGTVSLRCLIGIDGSVEKIDVQKGNELLAPAAIKAVFQWKYKPLLLNGQAVEVEMVVGLGEGAVSGGNSGHRRPRSQGGQGNWGKVRVARPPDESAASCPSRAA